MRMATGDLKPDLVLTLSADDPVDVTTATEVRIIGKRGNNVIFDRAPDDTDIVANTSVLTMYWVDGDTDTIGRIMVEIEVTWPGDKPQTFRADGGVDIYRDFDQLALTPAPPDDTETAPDAYVRAALALELTAHEYVEDLAAATPGPPNGGAGGVLSGTYPNPGFAVNMAEQTELDNGLALKADKTTLGLPPYITTAPNPYNPKFNVYNWKASNTRRLRAGLGRAATGQLSEIVVIGNSPVTGAISDVGPVFDRLRAWPLQMRDELARHGIPTAGTGQIRTRDNTVSDARWAFGGSWSSQLAYRFASANGATATLTTDLPGDRVTVWYYDDASGATFTITVNGVLAGTVTQSGAAGWKKTTVNGTIAAGQTVVLTKTSAAGFLSPSGAGVRTTAGGLLVHNIGQGGSRAHGTPQDRWASTADVTCLGVVHANPTASLTNPDAVICVLGTSDKFTGTATDTEIRAAYTTIRNRWPSSDFIIGVSNAIPEGMVTQTAWETFVAGQYGLADTLDVPLIDVTHRLGPWTSAIVANGLNGDTSGHLKVEAFADQGRSLGQLLAS